VVGSADAYPCRPLHPLLESTSSSCRAALVADLPAVAASCRWLPPHPHRRWLVSCAAEYVLHVAVYSHTSPPRPPRRWLLPLLPGSSSRCWLLPHPHLLPTSLNRYFACAILVIIDQLVVQSYVCRIFVI
jgi:hypothetical protein